MALGTQDKEPRGLYSSANAALAQPFQTSPSVASRATSANMDQQLRGMATPPGMPAPAVPATAGPISRLAQGGPGSPALVADGVIQRFAQLRSPNMGIQVTGENQITPDELARQFSRSQPPVQALAASAPSTAQGGGTVNTVPASSFNRLPASLSAALSDARQAAASRGEAGSLPGDGVPAGGAIRSGADQDAQARNEMFARWGADSALFKASIGKPGKRDAALVEAAQRAYENEAGQGLKRDQLATDTQLQDRTLAQEAAALQQQGDLARATLAQGTPTSEGQQLQNQQAQMMMDLTRKAIGGDQEALKQLQALQGKSPKTPQSEALLEILKAYTTGQATALPGSGVPITQVMRDVAPLLQMLGGQAPAAAPAAPPADGTPGTLNGVRGVIRNGQFIPD